MNSIGRLLSLTTFGESHGVAIGGVLDGFPSGVAVDEDFVAGLKSDLTRRSSESKYYAKVLKILSKAKVQKDFYAENTARYLAGILSLEDLHRTRSMSKTYIIE